MGGCDSFSVIPGELTQVTQVGAHSVFRIFPILGEQTASIWEESEGGGDGGKTYVNGYGEGCNARGPQSPPEKVTLSPGHS